MNTVICEKEGTGTIEMIILTMLTFIIFTGLYFSFPLIADNFGASLNAAITGNNYYDKKNPVIGEADGEKPHYDISKYKTEESRNGYIPVGLEENLIYKSLEVGVPFIEIRNDLQLIYEHSYKRFVLELDEYIKTDKPPFKVNSLKSNFLDAESVGGLATYLAQNTTAFNKIKQKEIPYILMRMYGNTVSYDERAKFEVAQEISDYLKSQRYLFIDEAGLQEKYVMIGASQAMMISINPIEEKETFEFYRDVVKVLSNVNGDINRDMDMDKIIERQMYLEEQKKTTLL